VLDKHIFAPKTIRGEFCSYYLWRCMYFAQGIFLHLLRGARIFRDRHETRHKMLCL